MCVYDALYILQNDVLVILGFNNKLLLLINGIFKV